MEYTESFFNRFVRENGIQNASFTPNQIVERKTGPKPRIITRETEVAGDCKGVDCNERFSKTFRAMVEQTGPFCRKCVVKRGNLKREETSLETYGTKFAVNNEQIIAKRKATNIELYGNEHAIASDSVRSKIQSSLQNKYGDDVSNISQVTEVQKLKKKNRIDNNNIKYNLEYLETLLDKSDAVLIDQMDEIDLSRESEIKFQCQCGATHVKNFRVIEMYGAFCENCQAKQAVERTIETNLQTRGVPYAAQDVNVQQKIRETNLKTRGVPNPAQDINVREKMKQTCLQNLGVPFPMQNAEVIKKAKRTAFSTKPYTMPSGAIRKIQGFENFTIDKLLKMGFTEEDIVTDDEQVPEIWYTYEGEEHRYFGDTFVVPVNTIYETKSIWTLNLEYEKNMAKKKACEEQGYKHVILVFDKMGKLLQEL